MDRSINREFGIFELGRNKIKMSLIIIDILSFFMLV